MSDTAKQSEELLGAIIEELETNERIIRDFGRIAGYVPPRAEEKKKWTASEIRTLTDVKVIARGTNTRLRGIKYKQYRPDLIVLDDIENDENVQSSEQREKLRNLFTKSILNLGSHETQILMVGTILHFDSLLMNIIENPPEGWFVKLYRAIESNEPLWPEWWTLDLLEKKKEDIGSIAFEQEFMNNPLDPSQQVLFTEEFYEGIDLNFCDCYAYLDLSSREKEQNDFCAIVTIARERKTGELYTVDPQRMKGKMKDVLAWFFNYYKKYKHKQIGIESNNFQQWFFQRVREIGNEQGIYPPVIDIEQIKDKVTRARDISVYTENGTVKFHKNYQAFNAEIAQFPRGAHDDWVDSLVEGVRLAIGVGTGGDIEAGDSSKRTGIWREYHDSRL
jgi:predicted phage terminase large subunit-like protein